MRCRELCTIEAPLRAPRLGLGGFPLVGTPRGRAARLERAGIPDATSAPSTLPRKACNALMHRGPTDSIQLSRFSRDPSDALKVVCHEGAREILSRRINHLNILRC